MPSASVSTRWAASICSYARSRALPPPWRPGWRLPGADQDGDLDVVVSGAGAVEDKVTDEERDDESDSDNVEPVQLVVEAGVREPGGADNVDRLAEQQQPPTVSLRRVSATRVAARNDARGYVGGSRRGPLSGLSATLRSLLERRWSLSHQKTGPGALAINRQQ